MATNGSRSILIEYSTLYNHYFPRATIKVKVNGDLTLSFCRLFSAHEPCAPHPVSVAWSD